MDPMNEPLPEEPVGRPKPARVAAIYGAVVFVAIFFVGWITGLGGSFLPNLGFSFLMGLLAAVALRLILARRDRQ